MAAPYQEMGEAIAGLGIAPATSRVDSFTAAQDIEFGYPVFSYVGEKKAYNYVTDTAKLVYSADFVSLNSIAVTVDGVAITPVVYSTNQLTTINLLKDAIDALTDVECVRDTTDTNNRTLLIRKKGESFTVSSTVTLGASQATASATYASTQVFVGLALRTIKPYAGTAKYAAQDEVNVLERGKLWAESSTAAKANVAAYVGSTGKVANSGVAINCVFRGNLSGAGLVPVEVNGQTAFTNSNVF